MTFTNFTNNVSEMLSLSAGKHHKKPVHMIKSRFPSSKASTKPAMNGPSSGIHFNPDPRDAQHHGLARQID